MKVSDTEAHVSLGQGDVEEGDLVALFRNECFQAGNVRIATDHSDCTKAKAGEGRIQKVLSDQYSVVRVAPGATFDEKTEVEKINKGGAE